MSLYVGIYKLQHIYSTNIREFTALISDRNLHFAVK